MRMKEERCVIQGVPAILYGDSSESLFFVYPRKNGLQGRSGLACGDCMPKGVSGAEH